MKFQPSPNHQPEKMDWREVLSEHERWLRTIVFARLRERDAVDDVMQEIRMAVIRQQQPLADPSKIAPWLYRLAVRQVLMYRRTCGRRRKLLDRWVARETPTEADRRTLDPLDWILADERQRLVREALSRIAPRDAELLWLKYTENWNYQQIAEHLGVSHSAVETRLHRARARLRDELAAAQVIEVES